jgi:hypothetical protein
MNRLVALGIVGWIAFAGLGGCQGPDPFERRDSGATGAGGQIVIGIGGHIVTGNGGSGAGGLRGSGGSGAGGRGTGGSSMGGRGMGGSGAGGFAGAFGVGGSSTGGRGMGGSGAGGRIVDGGANCITAIAMAGYTAGTAPPCSACMDQNHVSFEMKCKTMIDCMAGQTQPCTGMCELACFNAAGGNGPLSGCVDALLMAGGCQ